MGLKDLFFVSDNPENETEKPVQEVKSSNTNSSTMKFPTIEPQIEQKETSNYSGLFGKSSGEKETPKVTPSFNSNNVSQEHLLKAVEIYQNGFDSLNQNGYDFYEFYQAIISAGVENQMVYPMAFSMASAMDKSITKDKLVEQARFYISEINKVYSDNISKGNNKKLELTSQKNEENKNLMNDLQSMEQQMESLKIQIEDRRRKIGEIDGKYSPMITDIEGKLLANEMAKDKIIKSIEAVQQGIINNVK